MNQETRWFMVAWLQVKVGGTLTFTTLCSF